MNKEKFETILDYGASKLRIGTFNNDYTKNKFFLNEEKINNLENYINKINKIIKILERKINTHLNNINIMIDTSEFFCIDIGLKKNFDNRLVKSKDIKHLLNTINSLIKQNYSNYKIVHFIITKIVIDKKEFDYFPENDLNCDEFIIEVKFICLTSIFFEKLTNTFKKQFLTIKKIFCTSYIKSYCFKDFFENYDKKFFLDIGYEKSSLTIYKKNKFKLIKYLDLGGNHITKDISKVFKISIIEAEKIKKKLSNLGITFTNKIDENHNINDINLLKELSEKNIQINLLMKVIFARIDEIFDLIFKDVDYSYFFKNDEKSILIFIGEGSKILNKNSITLNEKFDYFDEINFFEENTTLVCDSGYKFIQTKNPNEISLVPKKSDKYGFFEKMFNLFK